MKDYREYQRLYQRKWRKTPKGRANKKIRDKRWRESAAGKEYSRRYSQKWQTSDAGKRSHRVACKKYRSSRKGKDKRNAHLKIRRLSDLNFRMKACLYRRIHHALNGANKSDKTMKLLGCTIESFKIYLESRFQVGMTWDNYGTRWHIDHIVPCALFDLRKPEHQRICFHFSNLRPMWAKANRKRGLKGSHQIGLGI